MRYSIIFASLAVVAFAAPVPKSQQANAEADFILSEADQAGSETITITAERHTRPVRSAEPEPEAIAGNRTPGPRIAEAEPEAAVDTTFGRRHVRLQQSAEPEPEPQASAGNRTPGPRIAKAESEAALDTSFGANHVRLQQSAEPEPEPQAIAGNRTPGPRIAETESVNINDEIEPVTSGHNTENPVKSAEAGGRGRRSANPTNYTPGTHAGDRRPGGGKPKPKSKKPKRQMIERPKIASEPFLRDSRPQKPGKPNSPTKGPRTAQAESEAALDTSFGTNHVRLQRSAEPEPEALPDRRPAPPHGKPGHRAIPSAVEEDVNGDVFQS